jgi:hypothetical protein
MRKLVRIGNEIFDLSRVVYAHLNFDDEGSIALEFDSPQKSWDTFIPLGWLENIDKRRLKRFRFFAGKTAEMLTEIFAERSLSIDSEPDRQQLAETFQKMRERFSPATAE